MTRREKRDIVLANKIPFSRIIFCSDKKGVIRCPFPENHEHGDSHKSAYYYKDSNTVHCFTFHHTWTPASLIAEKLGCSKLIAAKLLLRKFGASEIYSKPTLQVDFGSLKDRKWEELELIFCESKFLGIVYFLKTMRDSAKQDDLDIFNIVELDAYRIRDLIMEGERKCQNNKMQTE